MHSEQWQTKGQLAPEPADVFKLGPSPVCMCGTRGWPEYPAGLLWPAWCSCLMLGDLADHTEQSFPASPGPSTAGRGWCVGGWRAGDGLSAVQGGALKW